MYTLTISIIIISSVGSAYNIKFLYSHFSNVEHRLRTHTFYRYFVMGPAGSYIYAWVIIFFYRGLNIKFLRLSNHYYKSTTLNFENYTYYCYYYFMYIYRALCYINSTYYTEWYYINVDKKTFRKTLKYLWIDIKKKVIYM